MCTTHCRLRRAKHRSIGVWFGIWFGLAASLAIDPWPATTALTRRRIQLPVAQRFTLDVHCVEFCISHDGSMVLLYMVLHGSHQYTPFMLLYIPDMDPMGYIFYFGQRCSKKRCIEKKMHLSPSCQILSGWRKSFEHERQGLIGLDTPFSCVVSFQTFS